MVSLEGQSSPLHPSVMSSCISFTQATKLSKEYEKEGGGYENEAGSKNEPKKGAPKPKTEDKKSKETKSTKDTKDAKEKKSTASASQKKAAGAAGKKKSGDPKKAAAAKSSKSAAAKKGTKAKKP